MYVKVTGQTQAGSRVSVNGLPALSDANGNFSKNVYLNPGINNISIVATDSSGQSTTLTRKYYSPVVIVDSPTPNQITDQSSIIVTGTTAIGATVTVKGQAVTVDPSGKFSTTVNLQLGTNIITVMGTDTSGYLTTLTPTVVYQAQALLTVTPADNYQTSGIYIKVTGQAQVGSRVSVNGLLAISDSNGNFSKNVYLNPGINNISVVATDFYGKSITITRKYYRPAVIVNSPTPNQITDQSSITVKGTTAIGATVTVKGQAVTVDSSGKFSTNVNLQLGTNIITVVGTDTSGYSTTLTQTVVYQAQALLTVTPADNYQTSVMYITVTGHAQAGSRVSINGLPAITDSNGNFSKSVYLTLGINNISVVATDSYGKSITITRLIKRV